MTSVSRDGIVEFRFYRPEVRRVTVVGDFNEWTRGRTTHLLSNHLNSAEPDRLAGRARTYPGVFPLLHLDHVYYDSQLKLKSITVHRSRLALLASDHLPIVADFEF